MDKEYEVGIIGAGLAGLVSAIHLAKKHMSVLLLEKSTFPRHKVCGEYISMEVYEYLKSLGLDVFDAGACKISRFQFTTENNKSIESDLKMGGFGLSRYKLDQALWDLAKSLGVTCKIEEVIQVENDKLYKIDTKAKNTYTCKVVVGAQGKRSKLDKRLGRNFIETRTPWIGIKSHYKFEMPEDLVALHHFEGGYCGLSNVENQRVNACYLIHQSIFDQYNGIQEVQEKVLSRNPVLKKFFVEAEPLFDRPLSISQIYFGNRKKEHEGLIFIGDAAGMIHPLAGNGMAMAIASGKMLSELLVDTYGKCRGKDLIVKYEKRWNKLFDRRVYHGRLLHKVLERRRLSNFLMNGLPLVPWVMPSIIRSTHGKNLTLFE